MTTPDVPAGLHVVYSTRYHIDLGLHVFPTVKYRRVYARLAAEGALAPEFLHEPQPASWEDLALAHDAAYLEKARTGHFSSGELALLELPWSPEVVEGFRLMCGGTLLAARLAVTAPAWSPVVHLGGGFHHAFRGHGEGFCLFNDVAVAIKALRRDRVLERVAVIDLDVHHGNGTAFIFGQDAAVFTLSMHQQNNYPAFKPRGTLDVPLPDGIEDEAYLERLAGALPLALASHPELVIYLAGADPFEDDVLGGLALTHEGLRRRDRMVFEGVRKAGVPLAVALAGGYARNVDDTVAIHVATVEEARLAASGTVRTIIGR